MTLVSILSYLEIGVFESKIRMTMNLEKDEGFLDQDS